MSLNVTTTRARLQKFEFAGMFIEELGWSHPKSRSPVKAQAKNVPYTRTPIAQLSGVIAFEVTTGDGIPDAQIRAAIHKQITEEHVENLLIFLDATRVKSLWYWVKREGNKAYARDHLYVKGQPGDLFIGKLAAMSVNIGELDAEGNIPVTEVASRLKAALDVERVTKKFYDLFQKEHAAFLKSFANCIPVKTDAEWYASVMLNRLMFVYFIQHKGFLDNDHDYLRTRLSLVRKQHGKDKFHSFYRYFLIKLFHEGLGGKKRPPELEKLIGKIPYLNGGMFDIHELEKPERYGNVIAIPDEAFERIFDYFDKYDWVLDPERTVRKPGDKEEINPDVLGYIFEKYINQKQMGAYYTKEDITDYIGKNTIIPFLFDAARKECSVAFENSNGPTVWDLLRTNPDDYIYPAVKKGVETPLPKNIEAGIKDIAKRDDWNKSANGELALPTEIWREVVARRQRHDEIKKKLAAGEVRDINDLITLNLDIRQFAEDVIENCEGTDLLRAMWHAIQRVTVLDPTCGSGAFLFAALNILEPLYEGCLDRMAGFLNDETLKHDAAKLKFTPHGFVLLPDEKFADFARTLEHVANHVSPKYYIYKSIILQNLYGVDIMPEAVEICKLRLFLKLAAQVEPDAKKPNLGIEPLPDIDFNICAGNTLVGYATLAEVQNSMFGKNFVPRIQKVDEQIRKFRERQSQSGDITEQREDKQQIKVLLNEIREKLDTSLFTDYGARELTAWRKSHQPFHWYVEFNSIIQNGGFDVIVGNPPYVEYKEVKDDYKIRGYKTEECSNLYAFTWERSVDLAGKTGRIGLIIPVASVCTDGYTTLQRLWLNNGDLVVSNFNDRPGKLFDGLEHIRLSVVLLSKHPKPPFRTFTTTLNKWPTETREQLFQIQKFVETTELLRSGSLPKIGSQIEASVLRKVSRCNRTLNFYVSKFGRHRIYYTRKLSWYVQILDFVPGITDGGGKKREPSELKEVLVGTEQQRNAFLCALNSTVFFWLLNVWSDFRNLNKREVLGMPLNFESLDGDSQSQLDSLAKQLADSFQENSKVLEMRYEDWGTMRIQCIYPKFSKSIIDEIDRVLARNYGFTDEELDFIINYDIKYRLTRDTESEEA